MRFESVEDPMIKLMRYDYKQLTCMTCKVKAAGTEFQLIDWAERHGKHFNHMVQEDSKK